MLQRLTRLFEPGPIRKIVLFMVPVCLGLFIIVFSIIDTGGQQFSELAKAFLHGQLHFLSPIGGLGEDPLNYQGKIYWGEGPFPAVVLMPFVALFSLFHRFYYQGYLEWALVLGTLYFVYKLARLLKYSSEDSLIFCFGFLLGSVFIGVASLSSSWVFAQVVTTFLLFGGLYEFYTRKRWWLLGVISALLLLTRVTAAPIILFFALELWQSRKKFPALKPVLQLCLPFIVAIGLIGLYNFLRFHNPFNGGYAYQLLYPNSAASRALGIFSPIHIPANLYSMLFGAPVTALRSSNSWTLALPYIKNNVYGMSIFITSPYLLYLFSQKWSLFAKRDRNLLIALLVSCFFVLCYYGLGLQQFGSRYSLDFLPEQFLLFMIIYRKRHQSLSRGMKFLLLTSGIFNFYLLLSFI